MSSPGIPSSSPPAPSPACACAQHAGRSGTLVLGRVRAHPAAPRRHRAAPAYAAIVQWTLWGGASCMVAAGCSALRCRWRTALRAFRGSRAMFSRRARRGSNRRIEAIEAPMSWFVVGSARLARRAGLARARELRHAGLAEHRRRGAVVRAGARWRAGSRARPTPRPSARWARSRSSPSARSTPATSTST